MRVITAAEFQKVIKTGIVLVDFYADWCTPCKMLVPVMESLAAKTPGVTIVKFDVDSDGGSLSTSLGVRGIPTVKLFVNGEVVETIVGFRPEEDFVEAINKATTSK